MQSLVGAPGGSAGVKTQRRGKVRIEDPVVAVFLWADHGQACSSLDGLGHASSDVVLSTQGTISSACFKDASPKSPGFIASATHKAHC